METPSTGWRRLVQTPGNGWLLSVAIIIGVVTSLANFIFHSAIDGAYDLFWGDLGSVLGIGAQRVETDVFTEGWGALPANWWLVPLIPILGMTCIVVLDRWFPGEIKGYGLPRFLEIVNVEGGFIKRRWVTLKTLSNAITLGSGMSAGIEGPIAQIGGSIGSTCARALRPSPDQLRLLIACGSASAISATFASPIAGVMFAEEIVLLGHAQLQSLSLLVLASGTAAVVTEMMLGEHRVLHAPAFEYNFDHELIFYVMLGLLCGLLAAFFIRSFYRIIDWFRESRLPPSARPLLGALMVGCSLIVFPQIAANGYDAMNATFRGGLSAPLLLSLAFVKIVMTGVTLGSGGSGGVFAPSMFIGCVFGGGFATLVNAAIPGTIADPGSFALIGMGSFLSGATHAPLTAIFLVFELTRDPNVMLPMMITAITATLVAKRVFPDSIDHHELSRRGLHLSSESETQILKTLYVRGLVTKEFQPIPESMKLTDFVGYVTNSHHEYFPVVSPEQKLVGLLSVQDLRSVLLERESWPYVVVSELARSDVPTVRPSDTLFDAMRAVSTHGLEQIPVVDDHDGDKVVGMLKRSDLQNFFQKRLLARELHG